MLESIKGPETLLSEPSFLGGGGCCCGNGGLFGNLLGLLLLAALAMNPALLTQIITAIQTFLTALAAALGGGKRRRRRALDFQAFLKSSTRSSQQLESLGRLRIFLDVVKSSSSENESQIVFIKIGRSRPVY